jgi:hypothetical protein
VSSKCSKPCRFLSRKLACSLPPREFPDEQKSLLQTLVGNSHSACPLATFGNIDAGRCQIGKFLRSPRPPIRPVMADRRKLGKVKPGRGRTSHPSGVPARCVCERIGQHILPGSHQEPAKPLLLSAISPVRRNPPAGKMDGCPRRAGTLWLPEAPLTWSPLSISHAKGRFNFLSLLKFFLCSCDNLVILKSLQHVDFRLSDSELILDSWLNAKIGESRFGPRKLRSK